MLRSELIPRRRALDTSLLLVMKLCATWHGSQGLRGKGVSYSAKLKRVAVGAGQHNTAPGPKRGDAPGVGPGGEAPRRAAARCSANIDLRHACSDFAQALLHTPNQMMKFLDGLCDNGACRLVGSPGQIGAGRWQIVGGWSNMPKFLSLVYFRDPAGVDAKPGGNVVLPVAARQLPLMMAASYSVSLLPLCSALDMSLSLSLATML